MTPAEALDAIARVREGLAALDGMTDEAAITAALAELQADLDALAEVDPGDEPDAAWQDVAEAFEELQSWLSDTGADGKSARKAMSREERINLAVRIATRGRGANRGRDAADVILDGFYGGLGAALRGTGRVLAAAGRLAGRAAMAAGEATGRAVNAGAVHVDAYIRNGKPVAAHERDAPKRAPGAHRLYR